MKQVSFFYFAEVVTWFVIVGIQAVIMPWLALKVLELSGAELGLIVLLMQLPSLILLPFIGGILEKLDKRKVLLAIRLIMFMAPIFLYYSVVEEILSLTTLCIVNVLYGVGLALLSPTRDAMLHKLASNSLQSSLATFFAIQQIAQAIGYAIAYFTEDIGLLRVISIQITAMVIGVLSVSILILKSDISLGRFQAKGSRISIWQSFISMFSLPGVREAQILAFAVGFTFISSFLVTVPIIVKTRFGGEPSDLSLAIGCFLFGSISCTLILRKLPNIYNIGIVHLCNLSIGAFIILLLGVIQSFVWFCLALLIWGISAGVGMSFNRLIMEENIPHSLRSTAMAWLNFGMLGAAAGGVQLFGIISDIDPRYATWLACGLLFAVIFALLCFSPLRFIKSKPIMIT